jgi:hypothetical protein
MDWWVTRLTENLPGVWNAGGSGLRMG